MTRRTVLEGTKCGEWLVLSFSGYNREKKSAYYLCRCSCGKEQEVAGNNLVSGQSTRCSKCGHSGEWNGWKQKAVRHNGGAPLMYGTREYSQAASCKARAIARGLEFGFPTLSACALWIRENTPTHCPVLGIPLVPGRQRRRGFIRDMPSVDRRDSAHGYTPDNMQVMSMQANAMKNNATADELRRFASWVLGA